MVLSAKTEMINKVLLEWNSVLQGEAKVCQFRKSRKRSNKRVCTAQTCQGVPCREALGQHDKPRSSGTTSTTL